MEQTVIEIAKLIRPQELIYFVIIVGLFFIIWFQELSFRKKDKQQSADLLGLVNVINGISNQISNLAEILRYLATAENKKGQDND